MTKISITLIAALLATPALAIDATTARCTVFLVDDPTLLSAQTVVYVEGLVAGIEATGIRGNDFLNAVRSECHDRKNITMAVAARDALAELLANQ